MSTTEIRVRPAGWESSPAEELFVLSDMDHTMPKIYVLIVEVFKLAPDADKTRVVDSMTKGLEYTLSQFPILAGGLKMDSANGRLWVTKKRDSAVSLFVRDVEETFASYEELERTDFPAAKLKGHELLPKAVTEKQLFSPLGDNQEDDLIISTFQINFIKGGLILGVAIHHNCSDGPGCDGFLTNWAQNSAAVVNGTSFKTVPESTLDRSRLSAERPQAARWKELDQKFPVLKDSGGPPPPPPADFKMPDLAIRMWHFPKSKTEELKAGAMAKNGDSWISTYDAIISILWKTITRSKLELLHPDLAHEVLLVHALNTRKVLDPPLPETFMGNAVALPRTGPIKISELLADNNLPDIAQRVRNGIKTITPQYVAELPEWIAGLDDRRWININMSSFLGMDLAATSWQRMNVYQNHDFGFGVAGAIRFPDPQFEGYVFVYPSRAGVKENAVDEGIEVCVCLEKGCHDRLMKDKELLRYAQPRGAGEDRKAALEVAFEAPAGRIRDKNDEKCCITASAFDEELRIGASVTSKDGYSEALGGFFDIVVDDSDPNNALLKEKRIQLGLKNHDVLQPQDEEKISRSEGSDVAIVSPSDPDRRKYIEQLKLPISGLNGRVRNGKSRFLATEAI